MDCTYMQIGSANTSSNFCYSSICIGNACDCFLGIFSKYLPYKLNERISLPTTRPPTQQKVLPLIDKIKYALNLGLEC
ncbi:hypothetical protein ALP93_200139 [Pseudomonas syringae pv. helianthi]|nr:hypothetical protein ALP93_200139 [Pseudomonas syringae pv. helianthi]